MLPLAKPAARQPRKWTVAEDQKLREEVEAQRSEGEVKDWCRIAAKLPGRTNKDCRKRWHNSVAGGLKKGQWAKSEDAQLARGVQQFGQRWTLVAEVVGSRSADQCAKRWQQSLDPELDRSEWRESEDQILIEAVQKLGRHWKDIQRHHFPGRSKNCIKNRYTVLLRRYQNQGISLPEGAETPEPGTPNNPPSTYSAPDDDGMAISLDDILNTQTQVSTPETQHPWSVDEEHSTSWSSQESFPPGPADFVNFRQQAHTSVSGQSQWNWTTTSMEPSPTMSLTHANVYSPAYTTQPLSPYNSSYGGMLGHTPSPSGTTTHRSSFHTRAPTSSPRAPSSAPYQDAETMNRYLKYGMQNNPPYRY